MFKFRTHNNDIECNDYLPVNAVLLSVENLTQIYIGNKHFVHSSLILSCAIQSYLEYLKELIISSKKYRFVTNY